MQFSVNGTITEIRELFSNFNSFNRRRKKLIKEIDFIKDLDPDFAKQFLLPTHRSNIYRHVYGIIVSDENIESLVNFQKKNDLSDSEIAAATQSGFIYYDGAEATINTDKKSILFAVLIIASIISLLLLLMTSLYFKRNYTTSGLIVFFMGLIFSIAYMIVGMNTLQKILDRRNAKKLLDKIKNSITSINLK